MEQTDVMFLVGTVGVVVFIAVLRWALGPLLPVPPPSRNPMNSVFWNLHSEPQSETLRRALAALGGRQPEESVFGQLEGWTWRAVEGNPAMTVRFDENSIEDRHLSGHIVGTPGAGRPATRSFPVIARNSSFAYRGGTADVKKVATELNVRYVVLGSVREAGVE